MGCDAQIYVEEVQLGMGANETGTFILLATILLATVV